MAERADKIADNHWKIAERINKIAENHQKIADRQRLFGNSKTERGCIHMGKGRSNNTGQRQPNFDAGASKGKQPQMGDSKKK